MKIETVRSRFLITTEKSAAAKSNRIVGSAYQKDGDDHMTIHLRILPGITFFLATNWMGCPEFIVFSGRAKRDGGGYRFFHRIGAGYKPSDENVIEIHIPDLTQTYFIQLDPVDYHFEDSRAA